VVVVLDVMPGRVGRNSLLAALAATSWAVAVATAALAAMVTLDFIPLAVAAVLAVTAATAVLAATATAAELCLITPEPTAATAAVVVAQAPAANPLRQGAVERASEGINRAQAAAQEALAAPLVAALEQGRSAVLAVAVKATPVHLEV
jgi:hypothetical protein